VQLTVTHTVLLAVTDSCGNMYIEANSDSYSAPSGDTCSEAGSDLYNVAFTLQL
jgi:hypothetical protein